MNYALYYPRIEFQDYSWLWSASLLWDRIYRIVPEGYESDEPENVRILTAAGEIGVPMRPDAFTKDIAQEFLEKVESGQWQAAALEFNIPDAYARLHQGKVDVQLRKMIVAKGNASIQGEWLHVPTEFEALYMTYLAEKMARQNNLSLLSDCTAAWTGATYFKYDGHIQDYPSADLSQQLATLVVRDFIPQNILQIRPDDLLSFREKHRSERQRFLAAIRKAAEMISLSEDETVYQDRIRDIKKDVEEALSEYKAGMQSLKIVGWSGITSLTFPVLTKVASAITGDALAPSTLHVISALGIGVGLISGLADWQQKKRRLEKECDFSYLLHIRRNWKQCALYNNDYNYLLCREMEEFIND
jgi:hypothetical protein